LLTKTYLSLAPHVFPVSGRLELAPAIECANQLAVLPACSVLILDFREMSFVEPFGMLYLAQAIRAWRQRHPGCRVTGIFSNNTANSYAAFVGFFAACGISIGNETGAAPGSPTYLPMTYQNVIALQKGNAHVGKTIQTIAEKLARQLIRQPTGDLVDAVAYAFREIVRNVVEHSAAEEFGYCAQYWPTRNLVEIAIIDGGIGLRTTLARNPFLTVETDHNALKYALMPGISGKVYKGVPNDLNNPWQNSGYGLYMNYRLCNAGGNFFIASGSAGLYRERDAENIYHNLAFQGTALRLQLDTTRLRNLAELLKTFAHDGEKLSTQIGEGAIPNASKMSQLLREDFRELSAAPAVGAQVHHTRYGIGHVLEVEARPHEVILKVQFGGGRITKVNSNTITEL